MEPQIPIQEGALTLYLASLPTKDEYTITITLNYHDFLDLTLESDYQNPFTGRYSAVVRHSGTFTPATPSLPVIAIKIF